MFLLHVLEDKTVLWVRKDKANAGGQLLHGATRDHAMVVDDDSLEEDVLVMEE